MFWVVSFFCFSCSSALTIYNNARFQPFSVHCTLSNFTQVQSQIDCACLCFSDEKCLIASHSGLDQRCILYLATLDDGSLTLRTNNENASVLIFENKTLPGEFC